MWSLDQILGGCIAVIVAGMPALIALLKINRLSISVNGRLTELIAASVNAAHSTGREEGKNVGQSQLQKESQNILDKTAEEAYVILEETAEQARVILSQVAEQAVEEQPSRAPGGLKRLNNRDKPRRRQ